MQDKFDRILKGLLPEKGTVLLAVSGGRDSVCMAELFLHSALSVRFEVAHCNFSLRGDDSDADEAFVRDWCTSNKVTFNTIRFDTEDYAASKNISIEMAARELRYSWFGRLCAEKGFPAVAVAHNANDNAETLMLNLLRGTGIKGVTGMKPFSSLPVGGYDGVRLVRPLLEFSREEIDGYVIGHGVGYRDDRTNDDTSFRRNKLRHLVFPVFHEINPSFLRTFSREMQNFSQVDSIADEYYYARRNNIINFESPHELRLNTASLLSYSHWKYLLFRILEEYSFGADTAGSLASVICCSETVSGKVFNNGEYRIVTSGEEIIIVKVPVPAVSTRLRPLPLEKFSSLNEGEGCLVVEGTGIYEFNGRKFLVERLDWNKTLSVKTLPGTLIWDAEKMPLPVLLRGWKDGDWIRPIGLGGRKKLSDMFVDLKYSLIDKEKAAVLVRGQDPDDLPSDGGQHISALLCLRIDEYLRVTENTKSVYRIKEIPLLAENGMF